MLAGVTIAAILSFAAAAAPAGQPRPREQQPEDQAATPSASTARIEETQVTTADVKRFLDPTW